MGGSYAAGIRVGVLAAVGGVALAVAVLTGEGSRDGFFLAATGGFSLGIAAAAAVAGARAEGCVGERIGAPTAAATLRPPGGTNGHPARPAAGAAVVAVTRAAVAAVAHDMSNPLASLKSNLEWLRDALETPGRLRSPEEQAEVREVLRDARDAAERLRADVGALRAAGRGEEAVLPQ